jgi:hypothetical protein
MRLVSFLLVSTVLGGAAAALPVSGLVGEYRFDGNAADTSGYGNDGTVHGATLTTDRFGNADSAYAFDGINDYISFGPVTPLGAHSVSVWIQPLEHGARGTIVGHEGGPGLACGQGFVLRMSAAQQPYYLLDPAGCGGGGSTTISGDPVTYPASWMHLLGTFDGSTMSFYVDGQLAGQATGAHFTASNWLSVGATTYFNGQQTPFRGAMDDIRIYDRALTVAEIRELSGRGTPPVPEPSAVLLVAAGLALLGWRRRRSGS